MKTELYFKSNNHRLFGVFEKNSNSNNCAILLHGLTNSLDTCPLINEANELFLKNNISTFRFDYFGSGKSEGEFIDKTINELIQNTIDSYELVRDKFNPKKIIIWGRSFGGILAPIIASKPGIKSTIILSATLKTHISMKSSFTNNDFSQPFKASGEIKGHPILKKSFYYETKILDKLIKNKLKKVKNILIMQGTKDKIVYNLDWTKEIYNLVNEPKKLIFLKGADHSYKGFENKVMKYCREWLKRRGIF